MSQEEASRKIGVTQHSMSAWELGKKVPHKSNKLALARLYGKPVEWLFEEEGEYTEDGTVATNV